MWIKKSAFTKQRLTFIKPKQISCIPLLDSCCVNCTPKSDPINRCHVSFNRNKMLMSDFQLEIYRYSQCIKIKRLERPGTLMAKHCVQYEYQMKHKQLKLSQSCKKTQKKENTPSLQLK